MNLVARVGRWIGLALWVVLPVAGILAIVTHGDRDRHAGALRWTPVGHASAGRSQRVALDLDMGPVASVFAPSGLSGVVEQVDIEPGRAIEGGMVIARIGGIDRLAIRSHLPFARSLHHGMVGPDVAALNEVLRGRGLPADHADRFGDATERGVIVLSRQIGATGTAVFDPSWFLFVPDRSRIAAKVLLQPGMQAPSPGAPILELAPTLTSASWIDPEAGSGSAGAPEIVAGARLLISGRPVVELGPDTADAEGLLGASTLAKLAAVIPVDAETVDGVVVSAPPTGSSTIPAASIYTDPAGRSCVRWRAAPERPVHRSHVTVIDSIVGEALVVGLPRDAASVQLGPPRSLRRRCG